jgi:mono/diheme cytochrome c family protein
MMEKAAFKWAIIASAVIGFGACALAQDIDVGKIEYQSSCAACHGADGKGKGVFSAALKATPTDLTVLTKNNHGVFPVNAVYEVIDGRTSISSHGSREMPIWGYRYRPPQAFQLKQADDYVYSPPASPEGVVHGRILAVIDYLNRIQVK